MIDTHRLSFSTVNLVSKNIAEVIVNPGIEMDQSMVEMFHSFLLQHMTPPFSILVNKLNSYSYDFIAQNKLFSLEQIDNIAVVCYSSSCISTTKYITEMLEERSWSSQIFTDRSSALNWLTTKQITTQTSH